MKKLSKGQRIFFFISTALVAALFIIYYCNQKVIDEQLPVAGFFISVIASIIATIIYSILDDNYFSTRQDENLQQYENNLENYKSWLDEFDDTANVIKEMTTKGISRLKYRDEIEDVFWNSFISDTKEELILSGKTLFRWINTPLNKENFCNRIIKVINEGCSVFCIIYKDSSLNEEDKREKEKLKECLDKRIFPKLNKDNREKLIIKETDNLPYFYISNRIWSVTMPYFANHENNRNLALFIKANTHLDDMYYTDYTRIIDKADSVSWLGDYIRKENDA